MNVATKNSYAKEVKYYNHTSRQESYHGFWSFIGSRMPLIQYFQIESRIHILRTVYFIHNLGYVDCH